MKAPRSCVRVGQVAAVFIASLSCVATSSAKPTPCARAANADPVALQSALRDGDKLAEVFRDNNYVALQDKTTWAMWTFTVDGNPAHPAVICRIPVRQGDAIALDMVISCRSAPSTCARMEQEFKALNATMAAEMQRQQPR